MESILSAHRLHKAFGAFTAVHDISLELRPGECLALLGPNGAGKTTTVEMLEGLQKPDAGSIHIFGLDLAQNHSAIMQQTGVMLQETQLYKRMSVRETLRLFASFFRQSMAVEEAMRMVELTDKADTYLKDLSGGQKQRVYLACSLINNPRLLFLDEPTTGLDPQARRLIWDLLLRHKGSERGILLTTHYMDEAEQLADRIAVVDHGRIIAEGSPKELIERVCGQQILCFKTVDENETGRLTLQNELPWLSEALATTDGFEILTENAVEQMLALLRASDRRSVSLARLELRRSTLEDVFLKLTGRTIRNA